MGYTQTKLKKELLSKINADDQVQLEKVERYLNLVEMFYKLDKYIKEQGLLVETINGSQVFLKTNPALQEKAKINAQILSIEKSFEFNVQTKHDSDGGDLI
ncbi:P27 family phage terminase small subunit [Streptococcus agalactiae]|uniref:P27 family phage terminase small subunit n=1 Tax=Streptococcus agalactiae TaxID=1311 RepID=UPI003DA14081